LLYNEQIGAFITKEFLSNIEKDTFAEHTVLYLNRIMEELTSVMRDFARYVIESLKPKGSIFGSKWFWIIILIVGLILAGLLAPSLIKSIKGMMGTATQTVNPDGTVLTPT
jgi:hypothetical protein